MNNDKHARQPAHEDTATSVAATQYAVRDRILKLLSEAELARVSTAETAPRLTDGDEYIDLEHLEGGVCKAGGKTTTAVSRALPRKAVNEATWRAILVELAAS